MNVYHYEVVIQFRDGHFVDFTAQGEEEARSLLNDLAANNGGRDEIAGLWIWLNSDDDLHLEFKSADYGMPLTMTTPTHGRLPERETYWCLNETMTLIH
jgi:hypothetical protein